MVRMVQLTKLLTSLSHKNVMKFHLSCHISTDMSSMIFSNIQVKHMTAKAVCTFTFTNENGINFKTDCSDKSSFFFTHTIYYNNYNNRYIYKQ